MIIRIINPAKDYEREVWNFFVSIGLFGMGLDVRLDSYAYQTRATTRHKIWTNPNHWSRTDMRQNNIERPEIPSMVESLLRTELAKMINEVKIL